MERGSLEIKNSGSVEIFKIKIYDREPKDCYCYLPMSDLYKQSRICECHMDAMFCNKKIVFIYI